MADSKVRPSASASSASVWTSSPRKALARMDCVRASTRLRAVCDAGFEAIGEGEELVYSADDFLLFGGGSGCGI